ncbi:hypothetical protein P4B35_01660 [Pontiellaceae bacterium B12227]|nr:hypothetical protein [Pontiellaceae bacterium B12227]
MSKPTQIKGLLRVIIFLSISWNAQADDQPAEKIGSEELEMSCKTNKLVAIYEANKVIKKKLEDQFAESMPDTLLTDLEWDKIKQGKPAYFNSWSERADYIQFTMDVTYNDSINLIDSHYGSELDPVEFKKAKRSSFRYSSDVKLERNDGIKGELNSDLDVVVELPRLEKKLDLFVKTASLDELPGTRPTEDTESDLLVGLSRQPAIKYLRLIKNSVGIKVTWPPILFLKSEIKKDWEVKGWMISPKQRFYWESDDGFGEVTTLGLLKWINIRTVFGSSTGVRLTEVSNGAEWNQTFSLLRIFDEEITGSRRSNILYSNRAIEGSFSLYGHHYRGSHTMDRYRVQIRYRQPVYSYWVFLNVTPELIWRDEHNWQVDPGIRVGVELVFGNYYSRDQ